MSGAPPSEKEKELISQFRQRVKDAFYTEEHSKDHFLLRWIRAREGNLDKAEEMLRNSLKWRKENNVDNCLPKPLDPFIVKNFPHYNKTNGALGHPIYEVHGGAWDVRKIVNASKEKEFQDFINHFFEMMMLSIKKAGNLPNSDWPHTQFIYIADWEGYPFGQLANYKAVQNLMKFASQYEAHYPEVLHKVYFVNCPAMITIFMKLVKPFFAPKTYQKINVYGANRAEWEPVLREVMGDKMETLWTRFGGTRIEKED